MTGSPRELEVRRLARSLELHVRMMQLMGVAALPVPPSLLTATSPRAARPPVAATPPQRTPAGTDSRSRSAPPPPPPPPPPPSETEGGRGRPGRSPGARSDAAPSAAPVPRGLELPALAEVVSSCTRCHLARGRSRTVFGEGAQGARIMFVGEGPGFDEDRLGRPFVGRAGQLLDRMIAAMGLAREECYIANVVKCRPPGNRAPLPDEMAACLPFLHEQIERVSPEVIVLLGSTALRGLFPDAEGITRERGRWRAYRGCPVLPTFHPAYLLRNPAEKLPAWEDLKSVLVRLSLPVPANPTDRNR